MESNGMECDAVVVVAAGAAAAVRHDDAMELERRGRVMCNVMYHAKRSSQRVPPPPAGTMLFRDGMQRTRPSI